MAAMDRAISRKRHRQRTNHQEYLFWGYFHSIIIQQGWAYDDRGGTTRRRQQSTSTSASSSSSVSSSAASSSSAVATSEGSGKKTSAKGQLIFRSTCTRNWVQVTSLSLTCDSPGAYYYGSSTYRNSETCAAGDKARVSLSLTVSSQYGEARTQGSGSSTILVTIESGLYNQFATVMDSVNLCQLGVKGNNAYRCPKPGDYQLQTSYYVPTHVREGGFHYTPDLRITFYDSVITTTSGSKLVLGCVASGAVAIHQSANEKASRGAFALGLSISVLAGVFGLLILLSYLRKKRLERENQEKVMRRYSYVRTLPSGQVVPIPTGQVHHQSAMISAATRGGAPMLSSVPSMQTQSSSDESGLNLSRSPSYCNPPPPPTRPVI